MCRDCDSWLAAAQKPGLITHGLLPHLLTPFVPSQGLCRALPHSCHHSAGPGHVSMQLEPAANSEPMRPHAPMRPCFSSSTPMQPHAAYVLPWKRVVCVPLISLFTVSPYGPFVHLQDKQLCASHFFHSCQTPITHAAPCSSHGHTHLTLARPCPSLPPRLFTSTIPLIFPQAYHCHSLLFRLFTSTIPLIFPQAFSLSSFMVRLLTLDHHWIIVLNRVTS